MTSDTAISIATGVAEGSKWMVDRKVRRPSTREVVEMAIEVTKNDKESTWDSLARQIRQPQEPRAPQTVKA